MRKLHRIFVKLARQVVATNARLEKTSSLAGTHEDSLADDFRMDDVEVIQLSHTIIQVRYTLLTDARVTRRSTLYRRNSDTGYWQAVFHQGTVVAD